MKSIIIFLTLVAVLTASVDITQNMRALYKGVELTEVQEDYILDNQDKNIDIFKRVLNKEVRSFKSLNEKNVISFILSPAGEVSDIKLLKTSNKRKLDRATKKAVNNVAKSLVKPKENTELRYIISYRAGQTASYSDYSSVKPSSSTREPYFQPIAIGTTRFQHSSQEYVRVFETSRDGFVDVTTTPQMCGTLKLLTNKNQKMNTGYAWWQFNAEIPKGKYKLLVKTKKLCDVHLQYK